jgi:glutaredoxin
MIALEAAGWLVAAGFVGLYAMERLARIMAEQELDRAEHDLDKAREAARRARAEQTRVPVIVTEDVEV